MSALGVVPICAKFVQPDPVQRSTSYPDTTPLVSVDATQFRLICVLEAAVAVSDVGALGGVVPALLAARNAASCMTHQLEGAWVEVAL